MASKKLPYDGRSWRKLDVDLTLLSKVPIIRRRTQYCYLKMASAWKAAGLTYNRYLAVAARVVRRSLKEGPRLQAERRGEMELRFAKWEGGKQGENTSLAQANASSMAENATGEQK